MAIRHLNSPAETKKFAGLLAEQLFKKKSRRRGALVLALTGDLGSGKTTFVQGFLRDLGIRGRITSPTFVLIKKYKLKCSRLHASCFMTAYHIDCYRIKKPSELLKLGLKEILENPQNIVLIEWAEKIRRALPKNAIWIKIFYGPKKEERNIEIKN